VKKKLFFFAAALTVCLPAFADGFKARGFILPDGAVKIDEDRYRLAEAWDEAARFYRRAYPPNKYPRHTLRSQTPVRAMHIANPSGMEWEGVNLYEAARGEVRLYILPGKEPPAPEKGEKKAK
jgi:hypothetical protein